MKHIFTLLLISFFSVAASAGNITINLPDYRAYNVVIDGRSVGNNHYNMITLNNIQPGRHTVELYKMKTRFWESNRRVYASDFMVKPQYDLVMNVDNYGRLSMNEQYAYGNGNYDRNNGYATDNGYGVNRRRDRDDNYGDDHYGKRRNNRHRDDDYEHDNRDNNYNHDDNNRGDKAHYPDDNDHRDK